jgi:DNA recombination protein Rad52
MKKTNAVPIDFFDKETIDFLNEPLAKDDVHQREGFGDEKLSYLPAYHVIQEANRIFGFGNWGTEVIVLKQIDRTEYEKPPWKAGDKPKAMVSISYLCQLKLTISNGAGFVSHEDTGFGNGVAGYSAFGISSTIELASKEAVTDALKRCLRYYGNKFGLTLYDTAEAPQTLPEIEAAKTVTDEQLHELRDLYPARDIDDDWVLRLLEGEGLITHSLDGLRSDWYHHAFKLTRQYKLDEIEREWYEVDIEKVIELLAKAGNMNMLKALFTEAWNKTKKYDDKERQKRAVSIYEEMKSKLENKK